MRWGYWLHGRAGILVAQTVSLAVTVWGVYRLGRTGLSRPWAAGAVALALVYLARTFDEGNMTEEYSLPFLAVSLYLAARWCLARKKDPAAPHPWQWAAVYGASFAAILMLRVTSAVAVCSYVLVIALALLAGRQWKNLLANMAAFWAALRCSPGPLRCILPARVRWRTCSTVPSATIFFMPRSFPSGSIMQTASGRRVP